MKAQSKNLFRITILLNNIRKGIPKLGTGIGHNLIPKSFGRITSYWISLQSSFVKAMDEVKEVLIIVYGFYIIPPMDWYSVSGVCMRMCVCVCVCANGWVSEWVSAGTMEWVNLFCKRAHQKTVSWGSKSTFIYAYCLNNFLCILYFVYWFTAPERKFMSHNICNVSLFLIWMVLLLLVCFSYAIKISSIQDYT